MTKLMPAAVSAAVALSAALLVTSPAHATPLAAAANNNQLADATVARVTNVMWWGHHRFHRPFFHERAFFAHRAFAFHRFHHCRWC
jgi:hypothetical protein